MLELHKQCIEQDLVLKLLGPLVREALGKLRYQSLEPFEKLMLVVVLGGLWWWSPNLFYV